MFLRPCLHSVKTISRLQGGAPAHLTGAVVSASLFSVLGVPAAIGRDFIPQEDQPSGTGLPIILSHRLWQDRFGSDPKIVGQSLTLDGQTFAVVGVMPVNFQFPVQRTPVEFWTTIALDAQGPSPMTSQRGAGYLDVIARMKPKITIDTAQTEMVGIQGGLNRQYPENRPKGRIYTNPDRCSRSNRSTRDEGRSYSASSCTLVAC